MFSSKSKNDKKEMALVRQDPRTSVKTTSAKTESTNTTFKYSTTIDSNRNKVIYETIKQTIVHTQQAHETELTIRRTPTKEELAELLSSKPTFGQSGYTGNISKINSPLSQAPLSRNESPTLLKTQQTTVTQNSGRSVTSNVQLQRVKFDAANFKLSSPNSPLSQNYMLKSDARPTTPLPITNNVATKNTNTYVPSLYSRLSSTNALPNSNNSLLQSKSKLKPAVAYIFNHENFDDNYQEYRVGSSEDVKSLQRVFNSYKIKDTVIKDATLDKIKKTVKKIETSNLSAHSAIIIVILSHGSQGDIIAAKDNRYNIDETILYPLLKNKTLRDKPKLLFIQACKGSKEVVHTDACTTNVSPNEVYKCYSTFEGYVSYRGEKGSYFIQTLCKILESRGKTEGIKEIMEAVTRDVKIKSGERQIPTVTSTLTKPYVFGDYANN